LGDGRHPRLRPRGRHRGTYKSTAFDAEDKSILLMGGENTLYYPQSGAGIGAQRAYFKIGDDGALLARRLTSFNIDFDGQETMTAIDSLTPTLSKGEGAIYNLQGQRLNSLQRGVNIIGGKKVLVK